MCNCFKYFLLEVFYDVYMMLVYKYCSLKLIHLTIFSLVDN